MYKVARPCKSALFIWILEKTMKHRHKKRIPMSRTIERLKAFITSDEETIEI